MHDRLAQGTTLLFNGSRAMLAQAARVFPGLVVVHVTAKPEVLAERLAGRGRETAAEIEKRLERAAIHLPEEFKVFEIDNSGALEDAVSHLGLIVQPVRA